MDRRVVIIGGSIGGLASAIGLARRGWSATVIERDPPSPTSSGDEAFLLWQRPHVPQFRQPHNFSARSRNLLLEHIPETVDLLLADGIEEINLFKLLAPPELWSDEDDAFTGLMTRRPAFELALRRVAEAEPGVELLSPAVAAGLIYGEPVGGIPRVAGVTLADGQTLHADAVLDCGGRRTPVPRWLEEVGVRVPQDVQDCDGNYYCRYYRKFPGGMPNVMLFGTGGQCGGGLFFIAFAGDHDTFGIGMFCSPKDEDLKVLRHEWAFEAVAESIPSIAPWVDPGHAAPLHGVQFMSGHQNVRRHFIVDDQPLYLGALPVGDSLCTTNPQYGWGASMALTYAFSAVAVVDSLADDPCSMALAYEQAVAAEADGVYRESAALDRLRSYEIHGIEVPEDDREEMERQLLIRNVGMGALRDPILGRALLRRTNLLDRPDAILDDPEVVEHALHTREVLAGKPLRKMGPDREELLALLAAAAPASAASNAAQL